MSEEVTLQELIAQKDERIRELEADKQQMALEIKLLKEKIDLLIRRLFGSKSEKLDLAQLELLLREDELEKPTPPLKRRAPPSVEAFKPVAKRSDKKQRRERWPKDLAIEQEVIDPAEVRANPKAFRWIGEEVTEMLDYQPAKFFRRQIIRRKFVRREEPELAPVIAPLPESLQQRCLAAPGLLAQVIVSKYCDHLPLYRQEQIYWDRHRIWLPRQSMARWVYLASEWLKPIYRQIKDQMMKGSYLQVDETPIRLIPAMERPGWVISGWRTDRVKMCSLSGTRLERRNVWRNLSRWTLAALSNATATAPTITSPSSAPARAGQCC